MSNESNKIIDGTFCYILLTFMQNNDYEIPEFDPWPSDIKYKLSKTVT